MVRFFKNKLIMPFSNQKNDLLAFTKKNNEFDNLLFNLKEKLKISKKNRNFPREFSLKQFSNQKSEGIDIFLFHTLTKSTKEVNYKDSGIVEFDNSINSKLLQLNIKKLLKSRKINKIFLFSNYEFEFIDDKRFTNIKLEINEKKLMYERACCMYSFVKSKLFLNKTCCIDIDVFINLERLKIFDNDFDIALTHRSIPGFMPINEGIIFIKNINKLYVLKFFEQYIQNYLSIGASKEILRHYHKDVFQWRGGQLSLNLLVYNDGSLFLDYETKVLNKIKILFLPVFYYNFSPKIGEEYSQKYLNKKIVLHFKGRIKKDINFIKKII